MRATYLIGLIIAAAMGRCRGDPSHEIVINQLDVVVDSANPYVGPWSGETTASDTVILRTPFKADPPPELMVQVKITLDGDELFQEEETLCNMLENEFLGKEVVSYGVPKSQFPQHCPIKANGELAVKDYKLPANKIPSGIEGAFTSLVTVFMPGQKPIITITTAGKVAQKAPGVPKLG